MRLLPGSAPLTIRDCTLSPSLKPTHHTASSVQLVSLRSPIFPGPLRPSDLGCGLWSHTGLRSVSSFLCTSGPALSSHPSPGAGSLCRMCTLRNLVPPNPGLHRAPTSHTPRRFPNYIETAWEGGRAGGEGTFEDVRVTNKPQRHPGSSRNSRLNRDCKD